MLNEIEWQEDDIKVFGKTYKQPRLTALYGMNNASYRYSGITMFPKPFNSILKEIKTKIEEITEIKFTTVLLNFYRDGSDSNGWHSDDEKELGENPVIASISLGAERTFRLRHKKDKTKKKNLILQHGSLLIMKGETQHHWQHWNVTCPLVGQHHMVKGGCKLPSRVAEWGLGIPTVQPYSCTRHTNIARRGRFISF